MKSNNYRNQLQQEIAKEKERSNKLKNYCFHLQKVINGLKKEGASLIKDRVSVLGYSINRSSDLVFKVKESIKHYMKFKSDISKLTSEITGLESEYKKMKGPSLQNVKIAAQLFHYFALHVVLMLSPLYCTHCAEHQPLIATLRCVWVFQSWDDPLNDTDFRKHLHKDIINYRRACLLARKKAIASHNEKTAQKMKAKEISQKSVKDSKSVQLDPKTSKTRIQDSMTMPNFQDRIKTLITSALKDSSSIKNDVSQDKVDNKLPCKTIKSSLATSRRNNNVSEITAAESKSSSEKPVAPTALKRTLEKHPEKSKRVHFSTVSYEEQKRK
ncbi:histone-lysine N-methyltransferase, H3 lysine-79 specific [Caerostris extrusa]|uniref:Histone-lysine N-methyltransferase, H3 lysine-79 specific n=1 Tax=Caerostris extrusa TaxID=172846 RepID=A0AAV4NA75_CAEEX|nr:histone-lysine N-methyltransferase, H3 lysine-79 specific [Caerostris extrusa]